jgi:hypothetical protein
MSNFVIDMAAHAAGLSDAQLAKLEADAPGIAALVHTLRENTPLIQQWQALYEAGKPLLSQATPLFTQTQALYEKTKPLIAQAIAEFPTLDADAQIIVGILTKGRAVPAGSGAGSQSGGGIGS